MNFEVTEKLIFVVTNYVSSDKLIIKTEENRDSRNREYTSDFVEVTDDIGFEVVNDEIIVFFFTNHAHFEDYSCDLAKGDPDYIERSIEFLDKLFTLPIERKYTVKGSRVIREESFFIFSETERESCSGVTLCLPQIRDIFKKKKIISEMKRFDKRQQTFL